ncbi:MAG TPA: ATP-binding protein [Oligoflexia bacterium]|nr:ATP-binding protein [Oligoflexia bacterium]
MKQYKYSSIIFLILMATFCFAWLLSDQDWSVVGLLAFVISLAISYGFYLSLEKRIVQLSDNIDSKRSSDIRIRHLGTLRKLFSGSLLDVESKVHKLKKTQRKIIDELLDEKDKLSAILLQMVDGVMMLDEEDKILFYNPAFKKILGIQQQQHNMQGAFVGELVFRPQILEAIKTVKIEHKPIEEYIQFFDKGEAKYVYVQMRSLGHKGKSKILISLQDVSRDKTLEKNRNTMLENVSHELRTPLTVILGHLDILQQNKSEQEQNSYTKIRENVERMIVLTEDILKASGWQQHNLKKSNKAFNPVPAIIAVVENYQNIAKAKGIALHLKNYLSSESEAEEQLLINGNEEQFYQVVQNLVDNSIKYTPSGEVKVVIRKDEQNLLLKVHDTGAGIEPHEKKNIFKRFYRIDKSRKESGTGLGLSIVKAYLDQWSSHWTVSSKPNEGTRFKIEFKIINS